MKPTNDNGAHSFTEGATFETAENINEFLKEEKTMKPQFKHEEIYLDLSKLSEDKRKEVRRLLFKKPHYEKLFFLPDYEDKPFLICLYGKWDLEVNKRMEYTELTYSQFLDMMGESKRTCFI